jgi:integrase
MVKKNHIRFTKKGLEALPVPPKGKRAYYYDSGARGLCLAITPKGTCSFYVYRWVDRKPERVLIGRFPDLSIEKARGKAGEINSQIAEGKNPQDMKRAMKGELTLGDLFKEFKERHLIPHRKSKTIEEYDRQFRKHLSHWNNRKLTAVKIKDVSLLHVKLGENSGRYIANRVLALLSAMYGKALTWGLWEGDNPAKGVQRFKEESRARFLQKDEFPRFFKAVAEETNTTARDCITMFLLTGARRSNVQAMRWVDLNLDEGSWIIPETKAGEPQTVPLVRMAIELLQNRKGVDSEWVFPGKGKTGHIVELKNVWARITKRAELEDFRMHDLRRTFGSWQAITGASLVVIGKSLGHKSVNTTMTYSRLNQDPIRDSVKRAVKAMLAAGDTHLDSNTSAN